MDKRILWMSDSSTTTTGYATISKNILNLLAERQWECHQLGHNFIGQTIMPGLTFTDGTKLNFYIHGRGMRDYAQDILTYKIKTLQPNIFGILLDTFMLVANGDWFLNSDLSPSKSFFYFPSDGGGFPLGCERVLQKVDMPIAMSKFAQQQVNDLFGIKSEYIPHAVHSDDYFPVSEQEKYNIKAKYALQDDFVIGTVARNQGRKMLDRMMYSFAMFAKNHPDAKLLMHCDPYDAAAIFDMVTLTRKLNISNRVLYTGTKYYEGFDYKRMNEVYNAMDVFALSTSGEGFGIPTIEAMSCGIPVMVTDYTTTDELVRQTNSGIPVKLQGEITGNWNVDRGLWDIKDGTEAFEKLYDSKALREKYGKNGREAVLREYEWKGVINKWTSILDRMLEK